MRANTFSKRNRNIVKIQNMMQNSINELIYPFRFMMGKKSKNYTVKQSLS